MDSVSSPSQPALTIEDRLEILLLCFEAAADAFPPPSIVYAIKHRDTATGQVSFNFWEKKDLKHPLHNLPSTLPLQVTPEALARLDMCDLFTWLLEAETNKILCKHHGGRARWMKIWPVPPFYLARWPNPQMCCHSVLLVAEQDGSMKVMDGTTAQYGWPRSTWLLPFPQFNTERMDCDEGVRWPDDEERRKTDAAIRRTDNGFWVAVKDKMKTLFENLDWDILGSLSRESRVSMVKQQAERSFADLADFKFAGSER